MRRCNRIVSCLIVFSIVLSCFSVSSKANAGLFDEGGALDKIYQWLFGGYNYITANKDLTLEAPGGWKFSSTVPQKYYTTPTSSVQDKYGNVTNYYRGGDTTTTNIIDSYNKTFNTIWNTTNNSTTNNYSANVKLENFLNQYTTNNNNYTYSADFKSWYYDNTTNNYSYNEFNKYETTNNYLYYNQDNSRYYISIDNSTDEYYLIDVQYSPTFVTVNYTYNTTNNNYGDTVGDVTNIYYYELKDGRNSSSLTAAEVAGMDFGYDVANYELVTDDPNTLSLQHFDGDYIDSSSYSRSFYSQNRSNNYVDSGAFGQAVSLPNGSAAGVTIPGLSNYSSLSFDFRIYYNDISKLGIYFGDTNIFQEVVTDTRIWKGKDVYSDDRYLESGATRDLYLEGFGLGFSAKSFYTQSYLSSFSPPPPPNDIQTYVNWTSTWSWSTSFSSQMSVPDSYLSAGYEGESQSYSPKYGFLSNSQIAPSLSLNQQYSDFYLFSLSESSGMNWSILRLRPRHYIEKEYSWSPSQYVVADFSYDSYKNQWVSMRITLSGGNLYYFVNGDLVGSGPFTKPTADKFYIKSTGTIYLDELRVTTGSLSSTGSYTPSSSPYDTNKVLALPDNLVANTIYVQHNIPITNHRIGGVRPSNPEKGFLYIPLYDDRTGAQPQLYDGSNWIDVTAMVYDGKSLKDAKGFKFSPVGDAPDVDIDAKPERPERPERPETPGDDTDPDTCSHDWVENTETYVPPTCTLAGVKSYTCSKCEKVKSETIPLLDHDWKVKATMPNQYDDEGNQISVGFTIFECLRCQEQYKSIDGTAPPALNPGTSTVIPGGDDGEENEGFLGWLFRKIGELLGAVGKGIIDFLQGVLGGIFDGLISLVESVSENLAKLVNLFGSFGDALGVLWTWLPPEIMLVLVAGVSIFVLIALLKFFMK